jgi:hypothetical protein
VIRRSIGGGHDDQGAVARLEDLAFHVDESSSYHRFGQIVSAVGGEAVASVATGAGRGEALGD